MEISSLLQIQKGITSIIGAGGKTTLMLTLADELCSKGKVIICTSTRIYQPEGIKTVMSGSEEEITSALKDNSIICVSAGMDENKKLIPPGMPVMNLQRFADYVICEADGAKRLPIKAHADYEPVIPEGSGQVVLVIGADAIGQTIEDICHRPNIFAGLAQCDQEDVVTPEVAAKVINKEGLGNVVFINKVETEEQREIAARLSKLLDLPVVDGSLKKGEYECL